MATTWGEIKEIVLQKLFTTQDDAGEYIPSMPGAYNEAMRLLSTTSRYIVKEHTILSDGTKDTIVVNLKQDIPDLYELKANGIYLEDSDTGRLATCHNFRQVESDFLFLNGRERGTYRLFYYAYPFKVTADTTDATDLQIDDDVASLVPLYMASQLYKEDEPGIAASYRNEFEIGRDKMVKERNSSTSAKFVSTTGWW